MKKNIQLLYILWLIIGVFTISIIIENIITHKPENYIIGLLLLVCEIIIYYTTVQTIRNAKRKVNEMSITLSKFQINFSNLHVTVNVLLSISDKNRIFFVYSNKNKKVIKKVLVDVVGKIDISKLYDTYKYPTIMAKAKEKFYTGTLYNKKTKTNQD
jgi:hypothetical protein